MLTRTTTTNRSILGENLHPFNELARYAGMPQAWSFDTVEGLLAVEQELMAQAAMIAYVNDFHLLAMASAVTLPLLLFVGNLKLEARKKEHATGARSESLSPSGSDGG